MEVAIFTCSICGETSRDICVYCTKDACTNHLCERCRRCSDCCQCEVALLEVHENGVAINGHFHATNGHVLGQEILDEEDELVSDEIDEPDEELENSPE